MAEKYFCDMNNDVQITNQQHYQKSIDGYNRLPDVFTFQDVKQSYGYNGENSVYTKLRRLQKKNLIEKITEGEDAGKFRKINKMII